MGIFSALNGKIYRFNSINTPIDNELANRIENLDNSTEKLILIMAFGVAQDTIQNIFHPDHGSFKNVLQNLEKDNLRYIYNIIMIYIMLNSLNLIKKVDEKLLKKNAMIVLGLDDKKIEILFTLFKNKPEAEQMIFLWDLICAQIRIGLEYEDLMENAKIFTEIYNNRYNRLKNS